LTDVPDKKGEWWGTLGQLQAQLDQADAADLAQQARQLLEGADPARLAPQVPSDFAPAWQAILEKTQRN
jgi:hypothetical protein